MEQRQGRLAGGEGLHRQVQHDGAVLADGIEHDGALGLGRDFPHDVDAFGFEPLQMRQSWPGLEGGGGGIGHSCLPKIWSKISPGNSGELLDPQHQVRRNLTLATHPLADGAFAATHRLGDIALALAARSEEAPEIWHRGKL